jgi:hypothetical protein
MVWNADTKTLSNWDISTTAGALSAFTYTPADSSGGNYYQGIPGYQNEFLFMVDTSTRLLGITPVAALTDAGGAVAINLNTWGNGSGAVECFNCAPYRTIVSGSFTTTDPVSSAPEPAAFGLFGLGLTGFGALGTKLKRRKRVERLKTL